MVRRWLVRYQPRMVCGQSLFSSPESKARTVAEPRRRCKGGVAWGALAPSKPPCGGTSPDAGSRWGCGIASRSTVAVGVEQMEIHRGRFAGQDSGHEPAGDRPQTEAHHGVAGGDGKI